jgi:hypothetical protein
MNETLTLRASWSGRNSFNYTKGKRENCKLKRTKNRRQGNDPGIEFESIREKKKAEKSGYSNHEPLPVRHHSKGQNSLRTRNTVTNIASRSEPITQVQGTTPAIKYVQRSR